MRRALCIGIDRYPVGALSGCVADAKAWGAYLSSRGFDVTYLTDHMATYAGITVGLARLVNSSVTGDVLAFTYSGHGTYVRDLNGDEDDQYDEALVPVDYRSGGFLIDDDLRGIFSALPPRVTLTNIIDSCYSGTVTRLLGENSPRGRTLPRQARYLPITEETQRAHDSFREASRVPLPRVSVEDMNHVTISACMPWEVAYESNGMGDFTRAALAALKSSGTTLTLKGLLQRTIVRLGEQRWQTPYLDGPEAMLTKTLVRRTP